MTTLLDEAMRKVRSLPEASQNDVARILLRLVGGDSAVYRLSPEEEADLARADEDIAHGHFASDAEIEAVLGSHRA